jgi:dTDP-4-amino-4,6-dideoxygalactose transaminase
VIEALARFGGRPAIAPEQALAGVGRWPDTRPEDVAAVTDVLTSGREPWGFLHPEVAAFQREYAAVVGRKHCLAVASGTAALHLAVAALDVEAGSEILTPALGYIASATCILNHNCVPVFVDVDPDTFNIDPAAIEAKVSPRTRAVVAVDLLGLPADFAAIEAIARRRGLAVIEDAAQAQGARYHGRRCGALGDLSAVSLMPSKNLPGAGEGGLVTTDSDELQRNLLGHASLGMNVWAADGPRRVSHQLGFNYRPTPTSVAFVRSQLRRLDRYQAAREAHVAAFEAAIADIAFLRRPRRPPGRTHAYQMYRLLVVPEALGLDPAEGRHVRDAVVFLLRGEGAVCAFWEADSLPAMDVFQRRVGYGGGCPWTCRGGSDVRYDPADYPVTRRILDTYFMAPIARATHDRAFVLRQAEAYRKLAAHPEAVRALSLRISAAGGMAGFCGSTIFDEAAQRGLRLTAGGPARVG